MLFVRGCLGFCSVALIYCAVRLLPLSVAIALAFLAPVLVAALSPPLLHERPPRSVLAALALAAVGALVVAHPPSLGMLLPGSELHRAADRPSGLGVAAALGHAATAAGAKITVRSLGIGTTSRHVAGVIVLSAGLVSALGAGLVCLLQRSFVLPAQASQWWLLAAVGVVGYLHQLTMTAGLQRVPVSTASSLTYLSSALLGWALPMGGVLLPAHGSLAGGGEWWCCRGGMAGSQPAAVPFSRNTDAAPDGVPLAGPCSCVEPGRRLLFVSPPARRQQHAGRCRHRVRRPDGGHVAHAHRL